MQINYFKNKKKLCFFKIINKKAKDYLNNLFFLIKFDIEIFKIKSKIYI
jgi:hypothetical protein